MAYENVQTQVAHGVSATSGAVNRFVEIVRYYRVKVPVGAALQR